MRISRLLLGCAVLLLAADAPAAEHAAVVPTDAEVQKALADINVPEGEAPPTLAEFRAARVMSADGAFRAITLKEYVDSYEWRRLPLELARKYYPRVLTSLDTPAGFTLVFLLKDRDTVLEHTALVLNEPGGTPLTQTVSRLFPDAKIPPNASQGAQCFLPIANERAKFCVDVIVP